jgi:hypothetical protein
MATRQRKITTRVVPLRREPRRATFVIQRATDYAGFEWMLLDADNRVLCVGAPFKSYDECLHSVRAVQRLGPTAQIRYEL